MLCTEEAARAITPGMHGTTFGGNPLATAVAIAVIDAMKQEKVLDHINDVGGYFLSRLRDLQQKHTVIKEVRGRGLMIGIEIESADLAKEILGGMLARHIILNRTHETVLRFLPPYILQREHVDHAVAALDELFTLHSKPSATLVGEANG
jgi:acetylornithine/N-succinyldiaminopimelate aminotransferase